MYITQNSNNLLKNWKTSKIKTSASSQISSEGCISCGVHQQRGKCLGRTVWPLIESLNFVVNANALSQESKF